MRIIHTADWHLGARLGRIDRTDDLRAAVRRVAAHCEERRADVLIVAGDVFETYCTPETIRDWLAFLDDVFAGFLGRGGTVLGLTGNHDNPHLAGLVQQSMRLASPGTRMLGGRVASGRFHLATGPTLLRLADPSDGFDVQFVLLPFPRPDRYLAQEEQQRYGSVEERHTHMAAALRSRIERLQARPEFDRRLRTVLAAHVTVTGAQFRAGFVPTAAEAVLLSAVAVPTHFDYVALGDIHRPQALLGLAHIRYSGSLERSDASEAGEDKSVVLVDIGPDGRRGEPELLPLDPAPLYRVAVEDWDAEEPALADRHPDRERALVRLGVRHRPGRDDLDAVLAALDRLFPRWYERDVVDASAAAAGAVPPDPEAGPDAPPRGFAATVTDYLEARLAGDPDRGAVLALAGEMLAAEDETTEGRP
jgi:exonuclease SbcD